MTSNDIVMVIDTSKCMGCKACQVACQQWNGRTAEDTAFTGSYQNPPDLSGANLNVVKFTEIETGGQVRWLFMADRCRHCDIPLCKPACPKGAIHRHNLGPVWIRENLCIPDGPGNCTGIPNPSPNALRPCQNACPYKVSGDGIGIPRLKYTKNGLTVLETKMKKCTFCYNRFLDPDLKGDNDPAPNPVTGGAWGYEPSQGGAYNCSSARFQGAFAAEHDFKVPQSSVEFADSNRPACVLTCPVGAIQVNWVYKMRPIVVARLAELKASGYPNAIVYPYQWPGVMTHMNWILLEHPNTYGITY